MKRESPSYTLSILFDLASTLAVPRISKHVPKLMWPAIVDDELAEFETLSIQIASKRAFACEHERWPFQSGSEKVVSAVKTIAGLESESMDPPLLAVCFTKEYYLELAFQRFFASTVNDAAAAMDKVTAADAPHFYYRNSYANARSILAMPLLVDLARKTEVVVGQGNFGYRPSWGQPWVYPHLSHYLSAFYYPWVPNIELTQPHVGSAVTRAIERSRQVSRELFTLLSQGEALRWRLGRQDILELERVVGLFDDSPGNRAISPFVSTTIVGSNLSEFFKSTKDFNAVTPEFSHCVLNDAEVKQRVADYLGEPDDGRRSKYEKFIQVCRENLNVALRRELDQADTSRDFFGFERAELEEFLTWRFLEERLRLVLDRLLLHRRHYDPPLTRARFSAKFENIGVFAVEVPEVQFNLSVDDFNGREVRATPPAEENPREKEFQLWLEEANKLYQNNKNKQAWWVEGKFPCHALFETYVLDDKRDEEDFGAFWMALLLSHLVPPIIADAKGEEARGRFLDRVKRRWRDKLDKKPFAPLDEILKEKYQEKKDHPDTYGEECDRWIWLERKLSKLCEQVLVCDWRNATLREVIDKILSKTPPPWVHSLEIEVPSPDAQVPNHSPALYLTSEEEVAARKQDRVKAINEAKEGEERGQLFFSHSSLFGVNTTIFRALNDLEFSRNFITIRLIATERSSARTVTNRENQDHADFVGTYTVWKKSEDDTAPLAEGKRYTPRHDAWREDHTTAQTEEGDITRTWVSELHSLKLLIKNLGISLLNQERIREQERLNALLRKETARSTIAGIMARNMSHNIGSHVLASSGLLEGVDLSEIQKLHNFLQQRMDFIAQVVTYTPSWGEPMFLFKDLLGEFFNQYLLLANLIKDQGYPDITFYVKLNELDELIFERTSYCAACNPNFKGDRKPNPCKCTVTQAAITGSWQLKGEGADSPTLPERLVAIPGGAIGAHAFYVILENMLRNSAKYGNQQGQKEGLQVHIGVKEEDDFFRITIWDNTGTRDDHDLIDPEHCGCRVCVVQRRLQDELIDPESGVVTEKSRGIHEMKECAAILINPHLEAFGEKVGGKSLALWAGAEIHNRIEYLSYGIALQKPRLVGVVDSEPQNYSEAKSAGVFHYSDIENLARYPHQLALVYLRSDSRERFLKYIEKNHYLLPYRLLLVDKTGQGRVEIQPHPRRVEWCEISAPVEYERSSWENFVIELWEIWLSRFKSEGVAKWKMMISFDRDERHSAFKRWKHALESYGSNLVSVYLTRGIDGNFGAVEFPKGTSRAELQKEIDGFESSWIIFDNHGSGFTYKEGESLRSLGEKNNLRAYHDFGSKVSIRLFQTLESPPSSEFGFRLFVLGLLESSLMRVVIVDERLADAVYDKEVRFKKGLMRDLRIANCFPVFSVWTDPAGNGDVIRKFVSETIAQRTKKAEEGYFEHIHKQEGLELLDDPRVRVHIPDADGVQELGPEQVDTIIIHQGVIDVLEQNNLWLGEGHKDHHLEILHKISPSVIITSGRGRTIRHIEKKEIPFVEFSIIKDNTYAGLSKYHLVRSVLSVAGEKRTS